MTPKTAALIAGSLATDKPMTRLRMDVLKRKIAKHERKVKRYVALGLVKQT